MDSLRLLRGARVPLFDRFLAGAEEGDARASVLEWRANPAPGGSAEPSPLERSIERELSRLLNTRCSCPLDELGRYPRSVLDYGLPDYSALYTASADDQRRLALLVQDTIAAFEPRLRDVTVEVARMPNSRLGLAVTVAGKVLVEGRLEPVLFQVGANGDGSAP